MSGPGAPGEERFDFFISYTSRDEAWATWVAHQLELAGYRLKIQAWDFGLGSIIGAMEDAIRVSDRLIPVLSNDYLIGRYSRLEWEAYLKKNPSLVVPVQIEDIRSLSLLSSLVRINVAGLDEAQATAKLLRIIRQHVQPRYGPPDRAEHHRISFPVTAIRQPADSSDTGAGLESPVSTLAIRPDRIQLILLGDGHVADEAIGSLRARLEGARQCDLLRSGLPATEQLRQIADLVESLDPEEVSDVLVVFAGRASDLPGSGVYLHVRATNASQPVSTAMSLAALFERLRYGTPPRLRSYLILDAVDAEGQAVGPPGPPSVPVLRNRAGQPGRRVLAAIGDALTRPAWELTDQISRAGPLGMADLSALAGGELIAPEDSPVAPQDSPAHLFGLVSNPLDWPQQDSDHLSSWCAVISDSDAGKEPGASVRRTVDRLADYSLYALQAAYLRSGLAVQLEDKPCELLAGKILSSPGAFARAVEQVCRADLAIFDLTNFEPAVMILLGIRAVIRRGLTVCLAGEHGEAWQNTEPPFHLREVSLITPPDRDALRARIQEGIRQLAQPGSGYRDLPCFDPVRAVPQDPQQRRNRAFDGTSNPSMLALVPFGADYELNWKQISQDLPEVAKDIASRAMPQGEEAPRPLLQRTLDLASPRVVSAQLFEAIRLTDFCLVDLTGARPNVFFELGVRLAANRLHPVIVIESPGTPPGEDSQLGLLQKLMRPVEYTPTSSGVFTRMVERHLEFRRRLGDRPGSAPAEPPGEIPPAGVYDLAWRHAAAGDEVITVPVAERLEAEGDALMISTTAGREHLIYPKGHFLTEAADQAGVEYLIAAWLYLHFRQQAADGTDSAQTQRYNALTDKLVVKLDGMPQSSDADFMVRLLEWQAAGSSELGAGETGG